MSQNGTIYSTLESGPRYLEITEGYVLELGLDKENEIIGYKYVNLGKVMTLIREGTPPAKAYESGSGTYGRFADAVKTLDPRKA